MSHKTRHDTSFHHQESHKIQLLEDIKTNTNSINLNVDTLEVNTDTLETKIQSTNDKLDTFSGHSNNTTAMGDGSTQLRVLPLGYNQSAGQVRSLLCDSAGHQQIDVVSTALPTGGATSANQNIMITALQILDNVVDGNEAQVDVVTLPSLPTGSNTIGTVNLSATDNTVLDDIKTAVEKIDNCISGNEAQVDVVTLPSLPTGSNTIGTVNLSSTDNTVLDNIKTAVEKIDNCISGNEAQVDVVTLPSLPTGSNTIGTVNLSATDNTVLDNILTKLGEIDTAIDTLDAVQDNALTKLGEIDTAIDTIDPVLDASLVKQTAIDQKLGDIETAVQAVQGTMDVETLLSASVSAGSTGTSSVFTKKREQTHFTFAVVASSNGSYNAFVEASVDNTTYFSQNGGQSFNTGGNAENFQAVGTGQVPSTFKFYRIVIANNHSSGQTFTVKVCS